MLNTLAPNHQYKKEEVILSFPQSLFVNSRIPEKEELYNNAVWTTRDFANANQGLLRQAASYCTILKHTENGLKVAMYFREVKGDARLAGKRSIGYGGHPEIGDTSSDNANDIAVCIAGSAEREVREEIRLMTPDGYRVQPDLIAGELILRTDTEIDRCHVGFWLYGFVGEGIQAIDTDAEYDRFAGWASIDELDQLAEQGLLEFWSVEVLRRLKANEFQYYPGPLNEVE